MSHFTRPPSDANKAASAVVALITARGGSKGLPGKNILEAAGKPLLAWSIEAAMGAQCVTHVVLSSDDPKIIEVARRWGCNVPFERPADLAQDRTPSIDVVMHALDHLPHASELVLLQPTSPLRTSADIDEAYETMRRHRASACVSVCPVEHSPYWMYSLNERDELHPVMSRQDVTRRQDLPPVYRLNGAIYIAQVDWLRRNRSFVTPETVAYRMPVERSLDIDTVEDFEVFRRRVEAAT